jgi:hypothetical protein
MARGRAREELADGLLERAASVEPRVTGDLSRLASRVGGELLGLEHRFKSREGLVKKIGSKRKRNPFLGTDEQAAASIADALRYTLATDTPNHSEAVEEVLEELRELGYQFETNDIENSWYQGGDCKGINMNLSWGGVRFELQFHTTESFRTKMETHALYRERDSPETTDERRAEVDALMVRISDGVEFPPGISRIGTMKSRRRR